MKMDRILKVENVAKEYRLGTIGGATLRGELQAWWAKKRHLENPNVKIGAKQPMDGREKFLALDDVSFELNRGEALGIIGHNGAGKSTLLKLISRITAPTKGRIYLNGTIASMLEVGTGFHPELTGKENIYLNGAILGMTEAEVSKKFEQIVEFSELSKFIDTPVKRYSSGMYVKLAFSVAAHLNSDIMIMDEVLAVGDVDFQKKCLGRMGEAASSENRTVLYVSHNISTIRSLCTKCLVLDHGHVSYLGDVETGIAKYLGIMNEASATDFDFSEKTRRIDTRTTSGVKMISAHLNNKDNNIYSTGDAIDFMLVIQSSKEINPVNISIVNQYVDGVRIGGSISNNLVLYVGENHIHILFPTDNIPDGIYSLEIHVNSMDEDGLNSRLDSVKFAIPYSIQNRVGVYGKDWQHNVYGHSMYRPLVVENVSHKA
ncbi:MAG: ABC transporter ATP-binding protein [Lachnospiraceae bacterium]|nr:ABC transporter ATP-binding protein [Lachnospiraceae bacterium]